ncbi:colonization factor TcpF, partial [Vibrio cholerae]|nr:colonization factor TcpF [Vibrio cholerae]
LVNYANEGKLSTALNQEYITGRFLTKENGRYDIVNVGGVPDNTPVKLPAIVSKRGLMGTTSVVNAIPNEIYPHIKVYEGTLSLLKPGGAMIAVLEYDVSELSKHGYTNLWDVQFKVLVGVPHAETGVIYDPVYEETVKPYQPSGNLTGKKLYNVSTNDMHNGYKWSNTMFSNSNYKTQILLTKGDGSGVKLYSKAYSENFK